MSSTGGPAAIRAVTATTPGAVSTCEAPEPLLAHPAITPPDAPRSPVSPFGPVIPVSPFSRLPLFSPLAMPQVNAYGLVPEMLQKALDPGDCVVTVLMTIAPGVAPIVAESFVSRLQLDPVIVVMP